jgi:subfamily B ATP-binding cassette protein MsbA
MEVIGTESWVLSRAYGSYTRLIVNVLSIAVFVLFLTLISWRIMLVSVAGFALISLVLRRLSMPARLMGVEFKAAHQALAEHMLMSIQSMRTIRAYGHEDTHHARFVRSSKEARDAAFGMVRLSAWIGPVTEVGYLAILCVIVFGADWWNVGFAATLGAVALLYRLQPHAREFEGHLMMLAQAQPQLRSVLRMIENGDASRQRRGDAPFALMREGVRFENVALAYAPGDAPALDGASFTIPAGKRTALVGGSGAGKTSIVNMLLRLYEPTGGRILVDGTDLHSLSRRDWLASIAVAGQDVDLVEGTVLDNLRLARPEATDAELLAAAKMAAVDDFIAPLEEGYDTWVGLEGLRFSGGQRQRIGLARALLRRPRFLILDEATSALDYELEDRIRTAVEREFAGHTILIVTHRLETIAGVDHVIHLEHGRVVAAGRDALAAAPAE